MLLCTDCKVVVPENGSPAWWRGCGVTRSKRPAKRSEETDEDGSLFRGRVATHDGAR